MILAIFLSQDLAIGNHSGAPITLHSPLLKESLETLAEITTSIYNGDQKQKSNDIYEFLCPRR